MIDSIVVWYGFPRVQSPGVNKGTVLLHMSRLEYFSWVHFCGARNYLKFLSVSCGVFDPLRHTEL